MIVSMSARGEPNTDLRWDERIRRAQHLADRHPAAADLLTFCATLAEYQHALAEQWAPAVRGRPQADSLLEGLDRKLVVDAVPEFLSWLERSGPAHLAEAVTGRRRLGHPEWSALLDEYLTSLGFDAQVDHPPLTFVLEALLQPLAEQLAHGRSQVARSEASTHCRFCNSLPVVGVLREEAEGAKRSLVCGLCLTEWGYLRIVCPSCGENRFDALPVHTAEQIPGTRIESCDTCRVYLKTIDLTKDGLAIPLVDDFATVALDLWAREQGYVRLRQNLLRT